jgi:hypothetical protein
MPGAGFAESFDAAKDGQQQPAVSARVGCGIDVAGSYSSYGYDYGTTKSRLDLFDSAVERIERRLALLVPPPLRHVPVLIGAAGDKRGLPGVARHADIWHTFTADIDTYRRQNTLVGELATAAGREDGAIERSVSWYNAANATELLNEGATSLSPRHNPAQTATTSPWPIRLWPGAPLSSDSTPSDTDAASWKAGSKPRSVLAPGSPRLRRNCQGAPFW